MIEFFSIFVICVIYPALNLNHMYNCVHNLYDAEHSVVTSGYIVLFMQQNKDIICGCNCKKNGLYIHCVI